MRTGGDRKYCNNATYDYTWSDAFKYTNLSCAFLHADQISHKSGPSISFTTSFTSTRLVAKPNITNDADCTAACAGESDYADFNGRCRCAVVRDYFVVAPEAMTINFLSYFSWSRRDGLPSRTVAVVGEGTVQKPYKQLCFDPPGLDKDDPRCVKSELYVSQQVAGKGRANYLEFPVRDLLALASVDLDAVPEDCTASAPAPDQPGYECRTQSLATQNLILKNTTMRGHSSTTPRSRLTGLVVAVEAKYYNRLQAYNAFDGAVDKKPSLNTEDYHNDYLCVLKIKPYYQWTSAKGHEIQYADDDFGAKDRVPEGQSSAIVRYRYGVTFTFSSTGTVADYDPNAVLLYLVTLIVFISFSGTVTNIIATKTHLLLHIPGLKSVLDSSTFGAYVLGLIQRTQTYDTFENFRLDAKKAYAKFAIQAVVACEAFRILDREQSGLLTAKEMEDYLSEMMVDYGKEEVKTLVRYIFAAANEVEDLSRNPDDDETLSMNEFLEIFTEDSTTLKRLKEVIKTDDAIAKIDKVLMQKFKAATSTDSFRLTKMRSKKVRDSGGNIVVPVVP